MTDKEQIIIDGVDVSGCKFFNDITESYYCFGIPCKDRPNCCYKQTLKKIKKIVSNMSSYTAREERQIEQILQASEVLRGGK